MGYSTRRKTGILVELPSNCNNQVEPAEESSDKQTTVVDKFDLTPVYNEKWHELVSFDLIDAATLERYFYKHLEGPMEDKEFDFTHIYSYNKVMSIEDTKSICTILNKTNFKVLAWYFDPRMTIEQCGLKHVRCLERMPMQSTGKEKFSVYVYYRTRQLKPGQHFHESETNSSIDFSEGGEDLN
jgi:hypothetical protein